MKSILFLLTLINLNIIFYTRNRSNYNFTTATTIQTTDKIIIETTMETISNSNNNSSTKVVLDCLCQITKSFVKLLHHCQCCNSFSLEI